MILIPEQPVSIDDACKELRHRHDRGEDFSIVVVSEGYELEGMSDTQEVDQFGHVLRSGASAQRSRARSRTEPVTKRG